MNGDPNPLTELALMYDSREPCRRSRAREIFGRVLNKLFILFCVLLFTAPIVAILFAALIIPRSSVRNHAKYTPEAQLAQNQSSIPGDALSDDTAPTTLPHADQRMPLIQLGASLHLLLCILAAGVVGSLLFIVAFYCQMLLLPLLVLLLLYLGHLTVTLPVRLVVFVLRRIAASIRQLQLTTKSD